MSYNGNTWDFQSHDAGSIPVIRSKFLPKKPIFILTVLSDFEIIYVKVGNSFWPLTPKRNNMFKLTVFYEGFDGTLSSSEFIFPYDGEDAIEDIIRHYKIGNRIVITEPVSELLGV